MLTNVTFTGVTANGTAGAVTTTQLTLNFNANPGALTLAHLSITGATATGISGVGNSRTVAVTVTAAGTANVAVIGNLAGVNITGGPHSTTVHFYAPVTISPNHHQP